MRITSFLLSIIVVTPMVFAEDVEEKAGAVLPQPARLRMILEWDRGRCPIPLDEYEQLCTEVLEHSEALSREELLAVYLARSVARVQLNKPKDAQRDVTAALEIDPQNHKAHYFQGHLHLTRPDTAPQAFRSAREAIRLAPDEFRGYYLAGQYWLNFGNLERALEYLGEGIARNDQFGRLYELRHACYVLQGKYELALAELDRMAAVPGEPSEWRFYAFRALVLVELQRHDEAFADMVEAQRQNPDSFHTAAILWWCASLQRKVGCCLYWGRRIAREHPNNALAHSLYARALAEFGELKPALEAARRAAELNPQDKDIWNVLGIVHELMGDYAAASQAYERGLDWSAADHSLHYAFLLATCPDSRFRNGSKARQLAQAVAASEYYKHADGLMLLALAHAECGDTGEAAETARKALQRRNLDADARARYEQLIERFNNGSPYRHDPERREEHLFSIPPTTMSMRVGRAMLVKTVQSAWD